MCNGEEKIRVQIVDSRILISTKLSVKQLIPRNGKVLMTAKEIFDCMSKDPASLMLMNPSALNPLEKEKIALDNLFNLLKDAAKKNQDPETQKNCLEILSAPFGLLHPRRKEAVEVLLWAVEMPALQEFSSSLIRGAMETLKKATTSSDTKTAEIANELLDLFDKKKNSK